MWRGHFCPRFLSTVARIPELTFNLSLTFGYLCPKLHRIQRSNGQLKVVQRGCCFPPVSARNNFVTNTRTGSWIPVAAQSCLPACARSTRPFLGLYAAADW